MCDATAQQCASHERVYVAIDGSSLSLRDPKAIRGLGGVGAWKDCGRGLHVMTALALDAQGVAIGVCAQNWWTRLERSPQRRPSRRKPPRQETRFARSTWADPRQRLPELAPHTAAIAVTDAGFASTPVFPTAPPGVRVIVPARIS